ncbi:MULTISPECIES: GDSL-type esterase/lipase family protein [unclassified Streptomyces]|uniref:GDSL-type esterase/lipase family protein n=1 Tax=unclassified Streptomyces TaxID=2593676 RepID=UPI00278C8BFA|nr:MULTISPECIES: GDSL-type esterase/lipase family protein [unclassified Streptomyces]
MTWNMQGATSNGASMWTDYMPSVLAQARPHVAMLQEAGPDQPNSAHAETRPPGSYGNHTASYWRWRSDEPSGPRPGNWYMLFVQTNDPDRPGGRVNTIVMSTVRADEAMIVDSDHSSGRGRPAVGIRLGDDWYFSYHALSGGGGDAVRMLTDVGTAVERASRAAGRRYDWTVSGDFNTTPETLRSRRGFADIRTPDTGIPPAVVRSGMPTHHSPDGSRRELDFTVTTSSAELLSAEAQPSRGGSDHDPVATRPRATRVDGGPQMSAMPTGGYGMDGENGQDEAGGRGIMRACLVVQGGGPCPNSRGSTGGSTSTAADEEASFDYVGSTEGGTVSDGDNQQEAFPGQSMEQLRQHLSEDLPTYKPNVVVLQIDVANDLTTRNARSAADEANQLRDLLEQIYLVVPNTTVLVGDPAPSKDASVREAMFSGTSSYRARSKAIIDGVAAAGHRIRRVDTGFTSSTSGVDTGQDADGVPNTRGYRTMAYGYAAQLRALWRNGTIVEPGDVVVGVDSGDAITKQPLRVMPLGDSITAGVESSDNNGYRGALYARLRETVADGQVDFTGSQRRGTMPDLDHEGHPGWRIDEIAEVAACTVPQYRPNVITLHAGTNDFNQNYELDSAPERMKSLITRLHKDSPKAVVVVAKVLPTGKAGLQPRIDAFNAELPGIVADLRAQGQRVVLTDTGDISVGDGLESDAHPDDAGYAKLGGDFYSGIEDAARKGWIEKPDPSRVSSPCDDGDGTSAAGPGWRPLGVIAPGMTHPQGQTQLADFDGDGRDDYVRVDTDTRDHSLRIALNREDRPGQPRWEEVKADIDLAEAWPDGWKIDFPDVDGDGRADIVLIPPSGDDRLVFNYLNEGLVDGSTISWDEGGSIDLDLDGAEQDSVRFADVNGDGRDDYLRVGEDGSVHAYFNLPGSDEYDWRWEEHLNWAPGVFYGSRDKLRLADVDGDKKADYLMVGPDGTVHAYLNQGGRGNGGFEEHRDFVKKTGYPGAKSTFRDISGDGKADYVTVYDGGAVRCWLNRGGNL